MNNSITIDGEKFSADDLMLLTGEDEIKEPEELHPPRGQSFA